MGEARHSPERSAGSTNRIDLYLRCHLPETGQGRGSDPALLQYRSDEPAPRGNRQDSRTRSPRRPPRRSGRMASVSKIAHSRQHHHSRPAAEIPRTQSGRKHLAVHARQLALEPHLQILRRYRRSLLLRLEYARQLALEPHLQILRRYRRSLLRAWNTLLDRPWKIMSIGLRQWAHGF